MKRPIKIVLIILSVGVLTIAGHLVYLGTMSPKESYPEDKWILNEPVKNALIIVAHDDDMIGSSGTISLLCKNGWAVREMCFYQQGGVYAAKDSMKNPIRKKDLQTVAEIQGLTEVRPVDFNFRRHMDLKESYMPVAYERFGDRFLVDSLLGYIAGYIEQYKPTVIFTLDDQMGGYGHPDHVLISRLVLDYCNRHRKDSGFSVKRIYQPVFPPSLAEKVFGSLPVYKEAKKVYGVKGMPAPDVQVNIAAFGDLKKKAMQSYSTEQNSIRKFWPYYNWYPGWIYFRIFNRDFFRIIKFDAS